MGKKDKDRNRDAEGHEQEPDKTGRMTRKAYEKEMKKLSVELVKLQEWVRQTGYRMVVIFEGRVPPARAAPSSRSPRA